MKYTSLKNDIVNILHSTDYDLYLKFYNEDGNITLEPSDAKWCYINNYNIMIQFMDDEDSTITILKDKNNFDDTFKKVVQHIRELSILNGVSVQIRVYDNLNQRKLYNFIKMNIIKNKQDNQMNESISMLQNTLLNVLYTAKNTSKPSDFYLSEELKNKNYQHLLFEMYKEISSLQSLKNKNLMKFFNKFSLCENKNDIQNFLDSLDKKTVSLLAENIDNIKYCVNFKKNQFLNNIESNNNPTILYILENAKVYTLKQKLNNENLINAYNKLNELSVNAKNGTDIIRIIRNNKLCETYNVSRKELINKWLNETSEIKPSKIYIIENSYGEKFSFNENLKYGIKALAHYINIGGSRDDDICKNIINETIKYNEISSFLKEYYDSFSMKPYNKKFKKIIKENISKLNNTFKIEYFKSENPIDYQSELLQLQNEMNCNHPAIKYLAIEEAQKNALYSKILIENNINELNILQKELKPYTKNIKELQKIVEYILNHNIKNILVESTNIKDKAQEIYNSIYLSDNKYNSIISSALFNIIKSNYRLDENKHKFINLLQKYVK